MILKILLLCFTSTCASPIQLKYTQSLQSFLTPQEIPLESTGMSNVEVAQETTHPEASQPLFWPQVPSEMSEERLLKQDQVQHQMFKPQHIPTSTDVQQSEIPSTELPILQEMSLNNQVVMQQQILALHRLQALHRLNAMNTAWFPSRPLLVFLPMPIMTDSEDVNENENDDKKKPEINAEHKTDYPFEDTDPESVIIEAANSDEEKTTRIITRPGIQTPYARFSLGEIISGIPWLPIEINVPDTVVWAYNGISNGISGLISIIGQWPFSRPSSKIGFQGPNTKVFLKQLMQPDPMPLIMMVPMNAPIAQLPML